MDELVLRWVDYGSVSQDVCLMIHGFGDGAFVWDDFARRLSDRFRVIAVNLRGHGDSEWSRIGRYDFAAHASDMVRLCQSMKLSGITVIGHSMGAAVALRLLEQLPDIARALVLVDYGPAVDVVSDRTARRIGERFILAHREFQSLDDYIEVLRIERPVVDEVTLERIAACSLVPAPSGGYQLKRDPRMMADFDRRRQGERDGPSIWDRLELIRCPALVVRGEASGMLPIDMAMQMASVLPRGQFVEVPLAGHTPMLDNPDGFASVCEPFVVGAARKFVRVKAV
ncbi:alpha/beta fold hydrolase [Paraburkholderia sp. NMBU_R16]|uniref:alpha/beta fold hydrolase n=1 Tax=Paraburkholderia sp. NMBU_R16 TaxID=2698676 RepID=UPI001564CAA3|nr:alpha/beta hydrolase [Paraburkholderia sp. NMBU_R16]NRO99002.1 alpha/beta fold hydrolase [Paraburkholderia sp. NMBU_R16]